MKQVAILVILLIVPIQASALNIDELLGLVAMPLAVAAVSEVTGVPMGELSTLVATLNRAEVAPVQVIEVLRYSPVALVVVDNTQPQFVQFVQTQVVEGVTGPRLFDVIVNRLRTYDVSPQLAPSSSVVFVDDTFIPAIVTTRIAERRAHPHGGPPGQLKKQIGVQTGAEIVHGTKPGRGSRDTVKVRKEDRVRVVQTPVVTRVVKPHKVDHDGKGDDKGKGEGHGKDKGKSKGKGKD